MSGEGASAADPELVAALADAIAERCAQPVRASTLDPSSRKPALIAGIAGAQGTGKTTLARALIPALATRKLHAVGVSLDDFYRTRAERAQLAREVHPLLATRGLPGTHDLQLAHATLDALQTLPAGTAVGVPRFDKAHDDRAPEQDWPQVAGPVDLVILEGYCLGAEPELDPTVLAAPLNPLERDDDPQAIARRYANEQLAGPYQALFARLDWLAFLRAPDLASVVRWRTQQEVELRAGGRAGPALLDEAGVERFVQGFARISGRMLASPPAADVVVELDEGHRVSSTYTGRRRP